VPRPLASRPRFRFVVGWRRSSLGFRRSNGCARCSQSNVSCRRSSSLRVAADGLRSYPGRTMNPVWRLRCAAIALGGTTSVSAGEVTLELRDLAQRGALISFSVPIARNARATAVRVLLEGGKEPLAIAQVRRILPDFGEGSVHGADSWLVEIPAPSGTAKCSSDLESRGAAPHKDGSPLQSSPRSRRSRQLLGRKQARGFGWPVAARAAGHLSGWEPQRWQSACRCLASTGSSANGAVSDPKASARLKAMRFVRQLRLFGLRRSRRGYGGAYPGKPGRPARPRVDLSQA
jgi:hypothetical protein